MNYNDKYELTVTDIDSDLGIVIEFEANLYNRYGNYFYNLHVWIQKLMASGRSPHKIIEALEMSSLAEAYKIALIEFIRAETIQAVMV